MKWAKSLDGFVSDNGNWRIRGPLFGKQIYWLYQGGQRHCAVAGEYDTAVSFDSLKAAKAFVDENVGKSRGGKRIGAGKKPGKYGVKAGKSLKLTPDVIAYLEETFPGGMSEHVDSTIRKQAGFKAWMKARQR